MLRGWLTSAAALFKWLSRMHFAVAVQYSGMQRRCAAFHSFFAAWVIGYFRSQSAMGMAAVP